MNKKGQVLVLFLLLLPIMIMLFAMVVDLGLLMTRTYRVKQNIKQAIKYGLESGDIESMKLMLDKNIDDEYVVSTNGNIEITLNGTYDTIFTNIFKAKSYEYNYKYLGYIDNGEIIIKEE